ncbi:SDR family oxidoreductase [Maribacter sp. 2307UL18-2]|uniref:SDR family oxidoreductase n=1 Tax=Maribacter sp. 2307UL18-2 TaxID=3386274 RepID=UPI0039BC7CB6
MVKTFDLTGKTILITGGYGFLGSAIVESLLFHGANVYVLGRNEVKFTKSFSSDGKSKQPQFLVCDVASSNSIKMAIEAAFNAEKQIDVLINNAFYSKGNSPEKMTDEDWQFGIDGSLNSVFRCIREIIPYFKKQKGGKIINVSSMYGVVAPQFEVYDEHPDFLNPPHYGAAKAGILQLTRYYASYLGQLGITVNAVTPGAFPSDNVKENISFVNALADKTCLKRVGVPEELAGTFVFLSADVSNYITGQNLIVDGGWTAK